MLSEYSAAQPTCTVVSVSTSRPYRSELRDQQAQQTRRLIADAARGRFVEKGWAGTSVRSVAAAAGVSEATVYHIYGSKAGLASSLIDSAELSADVHRTVAELRERAGDPAAQLRAFVSFDRRHHPDLGAAYREGRSRGDRERRAVFSAWPAGVWRAGAGPDRAVAVYGITVTLDSFGTATDEYGWSPDDVETWWHHSLAELLLS
jgi:AcrR family transcriptional regulator